MNKNHHDIVMLLKQGVLELNLTLTDLMITKLIQFIELLHKWNKTYNLTSISTLEKMVTHHLLDSLALIPYLSGSKIIDVGSGAGLPGIPLAIANPQREFTLLDSNGKKTRFMQQACYELKLTNTQVICERVEKYQGDHCFDNILARAFTSLENIVKFTKHLLCPHGQILAMKGVIDPKELATIETSFTIVEMRKLTVPGLEALRHIIIIEGSHRG